MIRNIPLTLIDLVAYVTQVMISVTEQCQPFNSRIYVVNLRVFSHHATGLTSRCCLALNPSPIGCAARLSNSDPVYVKTFAPPNPRSDQDLNWKTRRQFMTALQSDARFKARTAENEGLSVCSLVTEAKSRDRF